jgi:PadR family transcriptional regulator PadR
VMFALIALEDEAYGANIRREIEERTGRTVSAGSVYTILDRLERRGLVSSEIGAPTAARGGRRRKNYRIETAGARLLHVSHQRHMLMASGLGAKLSDLSGQA